MRAAPAAAGGAPVTMAVRAPDNEWNACCGSSFAIPTGQPNCHHIPGEVDEEDGYIWLGIVGFGSSRAVCRP